ncbi:MAG: AAA family ATPase [Planctomycetota bacterium]|jgi:predicted ATPase with chaperone activity
MGHGTAVLDPLAKPASETTFYPASPQSLDEAGLTNEMVDTLIFKYLHMVGSASGAVIASTLALPHTLTVVRLTDLKKQQLLGYIGAAAMGDFTYSLTERGRERAIRCMQDCMYVGPAPVPFRDYCRAVKAQSIDHEKPREENLRHAFSDLLIDDEMFITLGPAINSGRGMFLYGFPGNGKTSIAERITYCFGNDIYIPYAIHVDGFIIKLFDAEVHEKIDPSSQEGIIKAEQMDQRWLRIKRPTIVAGGELVMDDLEIQYNHHTKISEASMQLKSNCGTLVIDDFGRQRVNPFELLNRWIVPLEKRYDFLALANGQKIQVPFTQLLIFATNLEPSDLVDEAFLRRIPYKISVDDPTEEEYHELFGMECRQVGFEYSREVVDYVLDEHYRKADRPLRRCHPRDFIMLIKNHCQFRGQLLELTKENIDFAVNVYFTVM